MAVWRVFGSLEVFVSVTKQVLSYLEMPVFSGALIVNDYMFVLFLKRLTSPY